ncbi:MAG: hypothetical protein IJF97_07870 [Eggerthellaceae bacterium]|nr:hypothetical protein [Eggerthellaceae bacterium]
MPRVERRDMSQYPPCRQCVSYCVLKQFVFDPNNELVAVCTKPERRFKTAAAVSSPQPGDPTVEL